MSIALTHRRYKTSYIEDGTEQHPYRIYTVQDFMDFKNRYNGVNPDGNNDVHYKLMNDIDLQGYQFINGRADHNGSFDGNYKVIRNFSLIDTVGNFDMGLIGHSWGGTLPYPAIRRLGLENVYGNKAAGSSAFSFFIGAMANQSIEECYVTGKLDTVTGMTAPFCGYMSLNATIRNCWSNIMINKNNSGGNSTGGIVGNIAYNTGLVDRCLALGNISSIASAQGIAGIGGGGSVQNVVTNCVSAMQQLVLSTGSSAYRIRPATTTGINNYALDSMLVNGSVITNGTTTNQNGANATELQLKSTAFYRDTMGWDMDNIWEIETEGVTFPRLRGFYK